MLEIKVWLGGEGKCELGAKPGTGDEPGVIEALLRRLEPTGWRVDGGTPWRKIRKFRVGMGARGGENHEDIHNVCGLALEALDKGCEVLAFARDVDADDRRAEAVVRGIAAARERYPLVRVIGGCAHPAIEGWILALAGVSGTNEMSRQRTLDELAARNIPEKTHHAYVPVVATADLMRLPTGCDSLVAWLDAARGELSTAVHGAPP